MQSPPPPSTLKKPLIVSSPSTANRPGSSSSSSSSKHSKKERHGCASLLSISQPSYGTAVSSEVTVDVTRKQAASQAQVLHNVRSNIPHIYTLPSLVSSPTTTMNTRTGSQRLSGRLVRHHSGSRLSTSSSSSSSGVGGSDLQAVLEQVQPYYQVTTYDNQT